MADIFGKRKRSEIMSKIGPKNSTQEIYVAKLLRSMGYRIALRKEDLPGKPDIVLRDRKKVVFVNGCFWHGHKLCSRSSLPQTNRKFWSEKIRKNVKRDKANHRALNRIGWRYLVIWQCKIKKTNESKLKEKLRKFLAQP